MNKSATRLSEGPFKIADLAREIGVDPKTARSRLRKHFGGTLADLGNATRWTYSADERHHIKQIIMGDAP